MSRHVMARGLKFFVEPAENILVESRHVSGAWIEIKIDSILAFGYHVAPRRWRVD